MRSSSGIARPARLVAGQTEATILHRFSKATADRAQQEGRDIALGLEREVRGFAGELDPAIEEETNVFEELGGKGDIFGTVNAPEPEFFFVALQEAERLLEFLHGAVEGGGQEEDTKIPAVPRILHPDAHTVFTGLVEFHAATVVISNRVVRTARRRFAHDECLEKVEWTGLGGTT
jgi:hypothetical protein